MSMILQIPWSLYKHMMAYVQVASPYEITGLGLVEKIDLPNGTNFQVKEIFLPEQKATEVHCEIANDAMLNLINDLAERENGDEAVSELRFQWHSHACGSVFWSQVDEDDIHRWKGTHLISIVVNDQGDLLARLDILEPEEIYNIPLRCIVTVPTDAEAQQQCREEVFQKVEFTHATAPKKGGNKYDELP